MPYRQRLAAPVKTDKHEIVFSNLNQNASTTIEILLAVVVDIGAKGSSTEVDVGSHIYGMYIEMNFANAETTTENILHWFILGSKAGQTLTNPNVYYQDTRSDVLKRGMEMLPENVSTVFKRIVFVKIPKKFQRMTQEMQLQLRYVSTSATLINACGFIVYKEFY